MESIMPLFDGEASEQAKRDGMLRAAASRKLMLLDAQRVAIILAMRDGEVNADDVVQWYANHAIDLTAKLGNAMGSLFRGSEWQWTGKFIKSARLHAHSNLLRVWCLRAMSEATA